jgi:hypothetical protein
MKKILFFFLAFILVLSSSGQFVKMMNQKANVIAPLRMPSNIDPPVVGTQPANDYVMNQSMWMDPVTCVTRYDMQTNYTTQRRVYLYPDETIGTACMLSNQDVSWTDRGTGYNYFGYNGFGPQPTTRVESIRTGWPEYHPFGTYGELIIAHQSTGPLVMNTRPVKGTGSWTQTLLPALPSNITGIQYPRVVTNGTNRTNIHIIALTLPTADGGQNYYGMNGALLYCHSLDGGNTWSSWQQLPGMTGNEYNNFTPDTYSWAEPHGDTLAFTVGFSFQDQFLMKSKDNGTTWTKTIIYHSPYNFGGNSPHFFYCPDGTNAIALDKYGIAHVVFGLLSDSIFNGPSYYFYRPFTQGIVYWNEHMPQLIQSLNPDTLFMNHQYVAWVKDTNVFHLPTGVILTTFFTSLTSFPDLVIDNYDNLFLVFAGETTNTDPNNYTMRHIFGRYGIVCGDTVLWPDDSLVDITSDWVQYNFAECIYPSASPTTDYLYVYILFQVDEYGGSYVKSITAGTSYHGQILPDDNDITLIKWQYPLYYGLNEKHKKPTISVSQNFPNPANGLTKVKVYLQYGGDLSLAVTNLTGKTVMSLEKTNISPGVTEFAIDGSQLVPGIYFYTVKQGYQSITKKMVVE